VTTWSDGARLVIPKTISLHDQIALDLYGDRQ
jgi:hypothetical protein